MRRKKVIQIRMIGAVMLLLAMFICGCGKSSAAKQVDELILKIGTVTNESGDKIQEAEKKYDALTENQKDEVENYAVLKEAREDFNNINIQAQIEEKIDELSKKDVRKQSDIEELEDLYSKLSDEQKANVNDGKGIDPVIQLTDIEKCALSAVKTLKSNLKNGDSLTLDSIEVATGNSKAISPYYVLIEYSASNSYGGTLDDTATIDIGDDFESKWWSMSALLGGLDENELLLYSDYLKNADKKYDIDCERIEANTN